MEITEIKPLICHCYRINWVFVKVMTDEGIHGVGEATLEYREQTVAETIRELRARGKLSKILLIWIFNKILGNFIVNVDGKFNSSIIIVRLRK